MFNVKKSPSGYSFNNRMLLQNVQLKQTKALTANATKRES